MSPVVDHGYFCRELEDSQELGFKGSFNYGSTLGSEEGPFLQEDKVDMGY